MKPERAIVAERALARHCAELLRPAPSAGELIARLDRAGSALAGPLAGALGPLLGQDAPAVDPEPAQASDGAALASLIAPFASCSLLLAGAEQVPVLLAIDGGAVLRMVDRAFGGKGLAPDPLPQAFPLSAELMIARIEALAMAAIDAAWNLGGPNALVPVRRDAGLDRLSPFDPGTDLAMQRFVVCEQDGKSWPIVLALPVGAIDALLGKGLRVAGPGTAGRGETNPADEPYGALPFAVEAVLVDMALPVSTVSALVPGQVLPVSVARNVPLRIGGRVIAHGTIGALDERVAVQINHAF